MPPAAAIATLLSSLIARLHSAPAAFSFCLSFPSRASDTRTSMPPAAAIATLLSSLTERFHSAPAARPEEYVGLFDGP